jgi:predicted O-linked N-acetylglucosamine transferase (SPINDLY family)
MMMQELIEEQKLDILIVADTMSEPMTHFLAHSRLAPMQVRMFFLQWLQWFYSTVVYLLQCF